MAGQVGCVLPVPPKDFKINIGSYLVVAANEEVSYPCDSVSNRSLVMIFIPTIIALFASTTVTLCVAIIITIHAVMMFGLLPMAVLRAMTAIMIFAMGDKTCLSRAATVRSR